MINRTERQKSTGDLSRKLILGFGVLLYLWGGYGCGVWVGNPKDVGSEPGQESQNIVIKFPDSLPVTTATGKSAGLVEIGVSELSVKFISSCVEGEVEVLAANQKIQFQADGQYQAILTGIPQEFVARDCLDFYLDSSSPFRLQGTYSQDNIKVTLQGGIQSLRFKKQLGQFVLERDDLFDFTGNSSDFSALTRDQEIRIDADSIDPIVQSVFASIRKRVETKPLPAEVQPIETADPASQTPAEPTQNPDVGDQPSTPDETPTETPTETQIPTESGVSVPTLGSEAHQVPGEFKLRFELGTQVAALTSVEIRVKPAANTPELDCGEEQKEFRVWIETGPFGIGEIFSPTLSADPGIPMQALLCLRQGNQLPVAGAIIQVEAYSASHRVFVTSTTYLGGFDYLNVCQERATAAGLTGSWLALVSVSEASVKDRVEIKGPIFNMRNEKVAEDADRLWSGTLDNPIAWSEFGQPVSEQTVWTGSTPDGSLDPDQEPGNSPCSNWTNSTATNRIRTYTGNVSATDGTWIQEFRSRCDRLRGVYCISQ